MTIERPTTVRLFSGKNYCSGTLVTRDLTPATDARTSYILTCAHFFRTAREPIRVGGASFAAKVADVHVIAGSDLAVVRMNRNSPPKDLPAVSAYRPRLWSEVITEGYGGSWYRIRRRPGRLLTYLPCAISRNTITRVAHPAMVYNTSPAVPGDSGGPVIQDHTVVGIQSLILNPGGHNTGIATVGLTGPMHRTIREALAKLERRA